MQDGAEHRHGEVALEVAVTVPIHHRHRVGGLHAKPLERASKAADALAQRPVAVAATASIDDLLRRLMRQRREQQLFDDQREVVSRHVLLFT